MVNPVTIEKKQDDSVEVHGMREQGMLGRGTGMGNSIYALSYDFLPPEAKATIALVISKGPFPYSQDDKPFGNRFGDLPSGEYLEYTVITPGISNRGMRRIVARKKTGQLFFTACHYERIQVKGGSFSDRPRIMVEETEKVDASWRNGFYIVTGMSVEMRNDIVMAIS